MSCGAHAGRAERARRGVGEADAEDVGPVRDVVGRIRMAFGAAPRITAGACGRSRALLDRRHDDRGRAVGLEAAVVAGGTAPTPSGDARYSSIVSGVPRISAFSFSCACARNVTAISPVSVSQRAVELLVAHRDPRVELRGASARRTAGRSRATTSPTALRVEPAPRARHALARPERRVAVPADDDEHVAGDAGRAPRAPRAAATRSGSRRPCAPSSRAAASSMPRLAASSSLVV